ncbi:MAG: winged helix-turn-helix transcriptional regulator, partial [Gammaproteobacteria bacterium]
MDLLYRLYARHRSADAAIARYVSHYRRGGAGDGAAAATLTAHRAPGARPAMGADTDLQRGLPRISSALLAKRLKQLETAGIVRREPVPNAPSTAYALTAAGAAAAPIVEHLGIWGIRWADRQIEADESDGYVLMEDIRRNLHTEALGAERCAMLIRLRHRGALQSWWLL